MVLHFLSHPNDQVRFFSVIFLLSSFLLYYYYLSIYAISLFLVLYQLMIKPPWHMTKCTAVELEDLDGLITEVGGGAAVLPLLQQLAAAGRTFANLGDLVPALLAATNYDRTEDPEMLGRDREGI